MSYIAYGRMVVEHNLHTVRVIADARADQLLSALRVQRARANAFLDALVRLCPRRSPPASAASSTATS